MVEVFSCYPKQGVPNKQQVPPRKLPYVDITIKNASFL